MERIEVIVCHNMEHVRGPGWACVSSAGDVDGVHLELS